MSVGCSIIVSSSSKGGERIGSVPRAPVVLAGDRLHRGHLDKPGQERGALFEIGGFEQGLLLARRERAGHRDRGDQLLGRRLLDRAPIGRQLSLTEKALQAAYQAGTVE